MDLRLPRALAIAHSGVLVRTEPRVRRVAHMVDDEVQPARNCRVVERREEPQLDLVDAVAHRVAPLWMASEITPPIRTARPLGPLARPAEHRVRLAAVHDLPVLPASREHRRRQGRGIRDLGPRRWRERFGPT